MNKRIKRRIKKSRVDDHRRPLEEVSSEQGEGVMKVPGGGQIQQRGRQEQRPWVGTGCLSGEQGKRSKRCGGD